MKFEQRLPDKLVEFALRLLLKLLLALLLLKLLLMLPSNHESVWRERVEISFFVREAVQKVA